MEKIKTLKDPEKFGYWALAIVCRKAIDWTRKKNSHYQKLKDYQHTFKVLNEETAAYLFHTKGSTSHSIATRKPTTSNTVVLSRKPTA